MLKVRIIPTLLWKEIGLVKSVKFDSSRRVGSAIPAVKVYNLRQVDELVFLDIKATLDGTSPDFLLISEIAEECFVPLTVGGGVKSLDDIKKLLRSGADKVALNSVAYDDHELIKSAAYTFGTQCVVISIDVKKTSKSTYECFSHSGTRPRKIKPEVWAKKVEELGAGEIILNSIDQDGTMEGYDLELIKLVSKAVSIPVIASGGAGNYQDMFDAFKKGGASSVAAASMFHYTEQTPLEAKAFLGKKGIPVRNINIKAK